MPKITDQTVISATTLAGDTPVQYFVPIEKLNATTSRRISSTQLVEFIVGQMLGATGSAAGLMSSSDKAKLDLITITSASSIDSLVSESHASATSGNAAISITGQAISVALDSVGGNLLSVQAGGLRVEAPTITISGAVSGSGTTAITTTLGSGSVSYANIQNVSTTSTLLGRYSAGAGTVQEISIGSGLTLTGSTLSASGSGATNLTFSRDATTLTVLSDTGTDAVLPAATGSLAGLQSAADKTKLDAITGTNTGDQTITLTGAVTGSGTGAISTSLANASVSLAKMADVATSTVFYRKTASTGAPEVQALATLKADLGLSGTNSGDQTITLTGAVTGSGTASFATTLASAIVQYANIQNVSATDKLLGRATAGAGSVEEITCTSFARSLLDDADAATVRTTIGLGSVATLSSIDYSNIQNVSATDKLLGRSTAGAGVVEEIACTAFGRSLIDDADASTARTTLGLGTLATQSGTFSGTSSGTNTGDQTITLTGDVTGSGTGSFAATIGANAVTLSKFVAATAASVLLGRGSASAGNFQEISLGSGLSMSGTTLSASGGSPGGSTTQVQYNSSGAFAGSANLTFDGTTLALTGKQTITGGTVTTSNPLFDSTQTWNAGAVTFSADKINITDTASAAASKVIDRQVGGTTVFNVTKAGYLSANRFSFIVGSELRSSDGNQVDVWAAGWHQARFYNGGLNLWSGSFLGFGSDPSSPATCLRGDAANYISTRNSTSACSLAAYNTYSSTTSYERGVMDWQTTANTLRVGTEKGSGGGSARSMVIVTDATARITIGSTGQTTINGSSLIIDTAKTPSSASDTGTTGMVCWDSSYVYVCTATNTWKRAAIATW